MENLVKKNFSIVVKNGIHADEVKTEAKVSWLLSRLSENGS